VCACLFEISEHSMVASLSYESAGTYTSHGGICGYDIMSRREINDDYQNSKIQSIISSKDKDSQFMSDHSFLTSHPKAFTRRSAML
jgi:hypothetical protein